MVIFYHKSSVFSYILLTVLLLICSSPKIHASGNNHFTVVLDPGHGGKDPGALGSKSKEKDIVLAITLKVGEYIEEHMPDVKIIYTRKTDIFIPLHERTEIANKNNADLFISIHANASSRSQVYGTETYAMGLHRSESNLEVAKRENKVIFYEENYTERYEGFDPTSAESYIIFSLLQNTHLNQSLEYASFVQNEFKEKAKRHSRGVKQAGFLILWQTKMPSVLVEVGYMSNPDEEIYLMSETGQSYLASAIFRAFREYKNRIEHSSKNSILVNKEVNKEKDETANLPAFTVQIMTTSREIELTPENFQGLEDVQTIKDGDLYKYVYGKSHSYDEINKVRNKISNIYPDAFIIATQGNTVIPVKQAIKEIKK